MPAIKLLPIWERNYSVIPEYHNPDYDRLVQGILSFYAERRNASSKFHLTCYPTCDSVYLETPSFSAEFSIASVTNPLFFLNARSFCFNSNRHTSGDYENLFWEAPYAASPETMRQFTEFLSDNVARKDFSLKYDESSDSFFLDGKTHYGYADTVNAILFEMNEGGEIKSPSPSNIYTF
ncbi:MAG: hypothetical protein NC114_10585 [Ruminococcus flavefaciens]|nr:hypothetical protein [Ruminococcus flavefaciens]